MGLFNFLTKKFTKAEQEWQNKDFEILEVSYVRKDKNGKHKMKLTGKAADNYFRDIFYLQKGYNPDLSKHKWKEER